MNNLVIVESPTKARTLAKYLGGKYQVEASMGHIRDLPKADLGVDVENNFEPRYIVPRDKTKRVNELKKLAVEAKTLWLATDPDREGEAIAWHLKELLVTDSGSADKKKTTHNVHRVVFHEITPEAIQEAFEDPRSIDLKLVDAQQARRVLDRLVGYKLSPLLWKKIKGGLSAGRVQSLALRLIVEREREIEAFVPEEYWSITAELGSKEEDHNSVFTANLIECQGKKLAIKNKAEASRHLEKLEKMEYQVEKVVVKEVRKYPYPPFTTSTLQQTAANRLGLSAKKTMSLAQSLYERGLITYMRTDSVNLSVSAVAAVRNYIEQNIGKSYVPSKPRIYKTKSKVAQEAHEAIRPTKIELTVNRLESMEGITREHLRLYELIWKRAVACQMSEAVFDQTTVNVKAGDYLLRATGSRVKFDGWLKLYQASNTGYQGEEEDQKEKEQNLPNLTENEMLKLLQLLPQQHFTEYPSRYNEASLIKKLEELGIGRPSTYAPIISTIQDRYYVEKKERKFFPTSLGTTVVDFLKKYFSSVFDYTFTAGMEDALDEIARGKRQWKPVIADFYNPFEEKIKQVIESADRVEIEAEVVDRLCPLCGKNLQVKYGRFGKFLACLGFPDCKHTESIEEKVDVQCPDCGGDILIRKTRKGRPFYGCKKWPTCKFASWTKPKPAK